MSFTPGDSDQPSLFSDHYSGARFSRCRTWRYLLWRRWETDAKMCAFVMLNPSSATESEIDPTVRRCIGFARRWGYGGLYVLNIFSLRATYPKEIYRHPDPVGPENDATIEEICPLADKVICAWGNHGLLNGRGQAVKQKIARLGCTPLCFEITSKGEPKHPLYVGYAVSPFPF